MPISDGREAVAAPHSPRTRRISRLILKSHAPAAGTVPATGAPCNDYYRSSGAIGSDERSSYPPPTPPPPKLRGLSLRPGSLGNDYHESLGTTGSDEKSSSPPTTPPPPKAAGTVPAPGSLGNDYHESLGTTGSDEKSSYPLPTPPPPKPRGLSPRPDRWVTTITNLRVLPVLTKDPATPYPRRHPQSCGDCPRARIAE
ncbi:MAG UNVERIFIED_CONTAM: hypothetical protein LVR18_07950 [Planctomycetaceae bacterium]